MPPSTRLRSLAITVSTFGTALVCAGAPALAAPNAVNGPNAPGQKMEDFTAPPDPAFKGNGVTVDEKLGAQIPLDLMFRMPDGKKTTLGAVLKGDIPTILTFNYSNCPMLCSVQLNGLSAALPAMGTPGPAPAGDGPIPADAKIGDKVAFRLGGQFRVVTIDLEPNEPLDKLAAMRDRYLDRVVNALPADDKDRREAARTGWTFLAAATPGDDAAIRRVADTVGFRYTYMPDKAEYAHPAALIFVSSTGVVTRYVYGIEFDAAMMRESIFKAGLSESSTAVGFMNRCYHFDAGGRAHAGVLALRIGAGAFVLLLGATGMLYARRRRTARRPFRSGVSS